MLTVILERHKGRQFVAELGQSVDVELPQYRILVTGPAREAEGKPPFLFGYVGVHRGAPINPIEELPEPLLREIQEEVNRQLRESAPHRIARLVQAPLLRRTYDGPDGGDDEPEEEDDE